jgi:hypothetical protein
MNMGMGNITDASIANPHWNACETCRHYGKNGCNLFHINLSVYLGDWIICEDYLPEQSTSKNMGEKDKK